MSKAKENCDVLVIGAGFYGAYISEYFSKLGKTVILCEKEDNLMQRASLSNQARVHHGYHYPRSILTALKSRLSFPRFSAEFKECIDDAFDKYYLIGKPLGNITARQFQAFCKRIEAPCEPAPKSISDLVNPKFVEACFKTVEYAFDAVKLKQIMLDRLYASGVKIKLKTSVESVEMHEGALSVSLLSLNGDSYKIKASQVFNCTYSQLNVVNKKSNLRIIPLKHEMTEMCLVKMPSELKHKGFTLMCGPFFSVMPYPSTEFHTFSHVRYTPHYEWYDMQDNAPLKSDKCVAISNEHSAWRKMKQDASRYMPILSECEYKSSIWEVKTILPLSETDDSRPILFKQNYGLMGYHCLMGGKIDNIYDVIDVFSSNKIGV